jgi:hypothetical protein
LRASNVGKTRAPIYGRARPGRTRAGRTGEGIMRRDLLRATAALGAGTIASGTALGEAAARRVRRDTDPGISLAVLQPGEGRAGGAPTSARRRRRRTGASCPTPTRSPWPQVVLPHRLREVGELVLEVGQQERLPGAVGGARRRPARAGPRRLVAALPPGVDRGPAGSWLAMSARPVLEPHAPSSLHDCARPQLSVLVAGPARGSCPIMSIDPERDPPRRPTRRRQPSRAAARSCEPRHAPPGDARRGTGS